MPCGEEHEEGKSVIGRLVRELMQQSLKQDEILNWISGGGMERSEILEKDLGVVLSFHLSKRDSFLKVDAYETSRGLPQLYSAPWNKQFIKPRVCENQNLPSSSSRP